jgi:hypothetical protein
MKAASSCIHLKGGRGGGVCPRPDRPDPLFLIQHPLSWVGGPSRRRVGGKDEDMKINPVESRVANLVVHAFTGQHFALIT